MLRQEAIEFCVLYQAIKLIIIKLQLNFFIFFTVTEQLPKDLFYWSSACKATAAFP